MAPPRSLVRPQSAPRARTRVIERGKNTLDSAKMLVIQGSEATRTEHYVPGVTMSSSSIPPQRPRRPQSAGSRRPDSGRSKSPSRPRSSRSSRVHNLFMSSGGGLEQTVRDLVTEGRLVEAIKLSQKMVETASDMHGPESHWRMRRGSELNFRLVVELGERNEESGLASDVRLALELLRDAQKLASRMMSTIDTSNVGQDPAFHHLNELLQRQSRNQDEDHEYSSNEEDYTGHQLKYQAEPAGARELDAAWASECGQFRILMLACEAGCARRLGERAQAESKATRALELAGEVLSSVATETRMFRKLQEAQARCSLILCTMSSGRGDHRTALEHAKASVSFLESIAPLKVTLKGRFDHVVVRSLGISYYNVGAEIEHLNTAAVPAYAQHSNGSAREDDVGHRSSPQRNPMKWYRKALQLANKHPAPFSQDIRGAFLRTVQAYGALVSSQHNLNLQQKGRRAKSVRTNKRKSPRRNGSGKMSLQDSVELLGVPVDALQVLVQDHFAGCKGAVDTGSLLQFLRKVATGVRADEALGRLEELLGAKRGFSEVDPDVLFSFSLREPGNHRDNGNNSTSPFENKSLSPHGPSDQINSPSSSKVYANTENGENQQQNVQVNKSDVEDMATLHVDQLHQSTKDQTGFAKRSEPKKSPSQIDSAHSSSRSDALSLYEQSPTQDVGFWEVFMPDQVYTQDKLDILENFDLRAVAPLLAGFDPHIKTGSAGDGFAVTDPAVEGDTFGGYTLQERIDANEQAKRPHRILARNPVPVSVAGWRMLEDREFRGDSMPSREMALKWPPLFRDAEVDFLDRLQTQGSKNLKVAKVAAAATMNLGVNSENIADSLFNREDNAMSYQEGSGDVGETVEETNIDRSQASPLGWSAQLRALRTSTLL